MKTTKMLLVLFLTLSFGIIALSALNYSISFPVQTTTTTPEGPLLNINAWENNGTIINTASNAQTDAQLCSDGVGGAIITWQSAQYDAGNIYAQRISAAGAVQWKTSGVAIAVVIKGQMHPQLCSDGALGAIITWEDARGAETDIYARRISATGEVQWTADGVALCTASGYQTSPQICSDGAGGAIITWEDSHLGNYDIYAQRISAAGAVQWTANGVAICTASTNQVDPQICSDGAGGAIITWEDPRGANTDIYAQRISAAGAVQWTANGVALCTASYRQIVPQLCSDGAGGAVITWQDNRSGLSWDIYAQRISPSGAVQWTTNGVAICTRSEVQYNAKLCSDGAGGAIIIWEDYRSESDWDIYAQRISAAGVVQWTADGVAVCMESGNQNYPQICSDGAAGAIITWDDTRNSNKDIYAQRISAAGAAQLTTNGVALCNASNTQQYPQLCSDGAGGAIITWEDLRSDAGDIYAKRVVVTTGSPIPFPFYSVILAIGVLTTIFAVARFKLQRINGKRQL